MKTPILLVYFSFSFLVLYAQNDLEPFSQKGLWGFTNQEGKQIISPKYKMISEFKEGLAAVRENGQYGYINSHGEYILPPIYDFADPFSMGYAKVWIDGYCQIIDKKGIPLFTKEYIDIIWDRKTPNLVSKMNNGLYGLINKQGELITNQLYDGLTKNWLNKKMTPLSSSFYKTTLGKEEGIIDLDGKTILPTIYRNIKNTDNDYFFAATKTYRHQLFNSKGELLLDIDDNYLYAIKGSDNFIFSIQPSDSYSDYKYGIINNKGKILLDTIYDRCSDLENGFLVVRKGHKKGWVTKKGEFIVSLDSYKTIIKVSDNVFFIEKENDSTPNSFIYKTINNRGEVLKKFETGVFLLEKKAYLNNLNKIEFVHPKTKQKAYLDVITGNFSILNKYATSPPKTNNTYSNILSKRRKAKRDYQVFYMHRKDAYYAKKGDLYWRLDTLKNVVWEDTIRIQSLIDTLDIDYMYGTSYEIATVNRMASFTKAKYQKRAIIAQSITNHLGFTTNKISLQFGETKVLENHFLFAGREIFFVNNTSDTLYVTTQHQKVNLIMQAKDKLGVWKDIDYIGDVCSCGAYDYTLFPPYTYWSFIVPIYKGSFKTKLRMKFVTSVPLIYRKEASNFFLSPPYETNEANMIYSEEFEGNINPAQLWRKKTYED